MAQIILVAQLFHEVMTSKSWPIITCLSKADCHHTSYTRMKSTLPSRLQETSFVSESSVLLPSPKKRCSNENDSQGKRQATASSAGRFEASSEVDSCERSG
jgi:hypothetical protein